ncbi:MAG: HigA family addiction module antidote protein [Lachnospiraceae bacterium]|nr:HigA family addiction module antidote protein [Lachnospiraceae bacterium]
MDMHIKTPGMGEILLEEFMEPNGISAYMLAKEIHVPVSRVQDILHDRRKITVDTSLRLARFFGVSDKYFLDIQNDIDLRVMKENLNEEIKSIIPYKKVAAM